MSRITEAYEARVQSGALDGDPAQRAVLPEFDRIAAGLSEVKPRWRKGLFAKKPEAVRGLYLWGGVGRGKSMLMDLFHEVEGGRRVHFHAFMQEVQAKLHAARRRPRFAAPRAAWPAPLA